MCGYSGMQLAVLAEPLDAAHADGALVEDLLEVTLQLRHYTCAEEPRSLALHVASIIRMRQTWGQYCGCAYRLRQIWSKRHSNDLTNTRWKSTATR